MLTGILLLVITGICWIAVGVAVSICSAKHLNYNVVQMIISTGIALFCLPVLLMADGWSDLPQKVLVRVFALHFIAGIANYFNYVFTARAMRIGHNGMVWAMMQSGVIAPFLMGVVFFAVPVPIWRGIGIVAILAGIMLLGITKSSGKEICGKNRYLWLVPTFGAFLLAGTVQCFNSLPSYWSSAIQTGSFFRTFAYFSGGSAAFVFSLGFDRAARQWGNCQEWKIGLILLFLLCLCNCFCFYNGINLVTEAGCGSIAYPIAIGVCIVGFTLYSAIHLKERTTPLSLLGLTAVTLGIIGISVK